MAFTTTSTFTLPAFADIEVEVEARCHPAEPDVGIFGTQIEDWEVTHVQNDAMSFADARKELLEEYGDDLICERLADEAE
jgi:hypothetical protein